MTDAPVLPILDNEEWLHTNAMKYCLEGARSWPGTYVQSFQMRTGGL